MTSTTTITLNTAIFKEVSKYLINDKFNRILEYSLLSKYIFKIITNQLINNSHLITTPFPFNSLKKYIDDNNSPTKNNISLYKYKLLQYKQIEFIPITIPIKDSIYAYHPNLSLYKKYFALFCKNIKSIRIYNKLSATFSDDKEDSEDQDEHEEIINMNDINPVGGFVKNEDTHGGFFSFEKVFLYWSYYNYPCSNRKESIQVYNLNDDQVEDYSFSFELLKRLNPKKVYIDTHVHRGGTIQLNNMDNILNQRSINTIKFINQITPISFFKKAISLENIKSLTINLQLQKNEYNTLLVESGLSENTHLKRLIIKRYITMEDIDMLFKLIENKKSLKALGLEAYHINDQIQLEPLYKLENITVLYCRFDHLKYILLHCSNSNSNIKKLKFKESDIGSDFNKYIDLFTQFFNQNNILSSISIITGSSHASFESMFAISLKKILKSCNSICKIKTKNIFQH